MFYSKFFALVFCMAALVAFGHEQVEVKKQRATGDGLNPCEDMFAYACHHLRDKPNSPEKSFAETADRALAFIPKHTKPETIEAIKKLVPISFFDFGWTATFDNFSTRLKQDRKKTHQELVEFLLRNQSDLPFELDWSAWMKKAQITPADYENAEDEKIRSSAERTRVQSRRIMDLFLARLTTSDYQEFATKLLTLELSKRTLASIFQKVAESESDFKEKLKDLVPERDRTQTEAIFSMIKTYATQISPVHEALSDRKKFAEVKLAWPPQTLNLFSKGLDAWENVFAAGGDQYFQEAHKIGMISSWSSPHRYFFILSHEYGHAIDLSLKTKQAEKFHSELSDCLSLALLPDKATIDHLKEAKAPAI